MANAELWREHCLLPFGPVHAPQQTNKQEQTSYSHISPVYKPASLFLFPRGIFSPTRSPWMAVARHEPAA